MKLSIVIPAFNEEKLLGDCLNSIHTAWREIPPLLLAPGRIAKLPCLSIPSR